MFVALPQNKWIGTNVVFMLNPHTETLKHMPHHKVLAPNIQILNTDKLSDVFIVVYHCVLMLRPSLHQYQNGLCRLAGHMSQIWKLKGLDIELVLNTGV
jgi:hypothetical protein